MDYGYGDRFYDACKAAQVNVCEPCKDEGRLVEAPYFDPRYDDDAPPLCPACYNDLQAAILKGHE